jgi:hypothetical protein
MSMPINFFTMQMALQNNFCRMQIRFKTGISLNIFDVVIKEKPLNLYSVLP